MITFRANIQIEPSPIHSEAAEQILRPLGYNPEAIGASLTIQVPDNKASDAIDQIR